MNTTTHAAPASSPCGAPMGRPDSSARRIGGSLLPSSSPYIFEPMKCAGGVLQVRECAELDTHKLCLIADNRETILASHPNGFSCHALAKRMAGEDAKRVQDQAEYIVLCGGYADHEAIARALLSRTAH